MDRSKLTIVAIVGVAVSSGVFAWWYRYDQGRRVLQLWGSQTTVLITGASQVELLELSTLTPEDAADRQAEQPSQTADREELPAPEGPLVVDQRIDLSRARGLIHARHALVDQGSYDWEPRGEVCDNNWPLGLRFTEGERQATFLLDFHCREIYLVERQRSAQLSEFATRALQRYLTELEGRAGQERQASGK